jgi:hypothetical protein
MPRISAVSHTNVAGPSKRLRSPLALLLVPLACLALTACGSSNSSPSTSSSATTTAAAAATTTTSATTTPATTPEPTKEQNKAATFQRRHAEIVAAVNCMHQHGYNLPEPNSKNEVNLKGFPTNSPRYQAASGVCIRLIK